MQSEEKGLLTFFFSVRYPHLPWYWLLHSANPSICCIPSYLQNYVLFDICYSRSWLPACRCPKGSTRIIHTLADHTRSSKCSTLHAVSDHAGWWNLTALSKSWRCQSTPVSKGKNFFHESSKCRVPRHAVGVWGEVSNLDSQSQFLCLPPQAKGLWHCMHPNPGHPNPSEHLREKQEEPRKSCLIVLHQAHSVPFTPLLLPVGYFVFLLTFHFVLLPADIFFLPNL